MQWRDPISFGTQAVAANSGCIGLLSHMSHACIHCHKIQAESLQIFIATRSKLKPYSIATRFKIDFYNVALPQDSISNFTAAPQDSS